MYCTNFGRIALKYKLHEFKTNYTKGVNEDNYELGITNYELGKEFEDLKMWWCVDGEYNWVKISPLRCFYPGTTDIFYKDVTATLLFIKKGYTEFHRVMHSVPRSGDGDEKIARIEDELASLIFD